MLAAAIVSATATAALALLAYWQITAGKAQTREQAEAALALARETRQAAERQWQPRVFAHAWKGPVKGDGDNAAPDEIAVRYFLQNEGTGPAFNVEHGVEVAGKLHTWNDWQYRSMRAGEAIPLMFDPGGFPVSKSPIVVGVKEAEWNDGAGLLYWTRFENLLGERFEVRNPPDATKPAEFRRLPEAA
jgi:type II secretory pathway pseudopilin PulG